MYARRQTAQDRHVDFASVLDEITRQPAAAPENLRPLSFDFLDGLAHLASAHAADRRSDFIVFEPENERELPLLSTDPDEIARELQLSPDMSPIELARVRRRFAARNHPDRVAEPLRDCASERMKIANMLIDRALADASSLEI
ncbi:hypothetical protein DUT91_05795 [Phyllobacterium salinisoli]|uniref:Uncharacterized protein n=1 Tax=Phyllobacterium salinisoli TaxID=1899321 RepID=A0A368K6E1_9HYPH|nr:hypothetical protein [Phyllobacterium salinisoli]RCS24958.1 hypothetical protein DUT91_05795 [Phyllobacterium salinisoli]